MSARERESRYFQQTALIISLATTVAAAVTTWVYYFEPTDPLKRSGLYYLVLGMSGAFSLVLIGIARSFFFNIKREIDERLRVVEEANVRLKEAYAGVMDALVAAVDTRDHDTHGHAVRVVALALAIGERLGFTATQDQIIIWGGLLHDIGKIGIRDGILYKPAAFTDAERVEMQRHAEVGHRMVQHVRVLNHASRVILYHHERWDGTGYPSKLSGTEIPIEARVFAVADTVDAMSSQRPYRAPLPLNEVYREVERCSGSQFCPDAASAFLELPREKVEGILLGAKERESSMFGSRWPEPVSGQLLGQTQGGSQDGASALPSDQPGGESESTDQRAECRSIVSARRGCR